jgi:ABC-type lipoprotein release transport system permease subunit
VTDSVLQELRRVDGAVCLGRVETGAALIAATTATARRFMGLVGISGILAFVLAASSLAGVLMRYVADSRREIAVRVALGATRRRVAGLVWRHAGSAVGLGLGLGVACGLALNRTAASAVEGVPWLDPHAVSAVVATLLGGALLAVLAATRALRADDMASSLRVG